VRRKPAGKVPASCMGELDAKKTEEGRRGRKVRKKREVLIRDRSLSQKGGRKGGAARTLADRHPQGRMKKIVRGRDGQLRGNTDDLKVQLGGQNEGEKGTRMFSRKSLGPPQKKNPPCQLETGKTKGEEILPRSDTKPPYFWEDLAHGN